MKTLRSMGLSEAFQRLQVFGELHEIQFSRTLELGPDDLSFRAKAFNLMEQPNQWKIYMLYMVPRACLIVARREPL